MDNLSKAENKILLLLLSKALFGYNAKIDLPTINPEQLFEESKMQTVIATVFDVLPPDFKESNPDLYKQWKMYTVRIIQNNSNMLLANGELDKIFKSAGIPYCTLKGFASAMYYPKPGLRQSGDIDYLINKNDENRAVAVLEQNGFKKTGHDTSLHIGFIKNKISYESHTQVTDLPEGLSYVLKPLDSIIAESEAKKPDGIEIQIPSAVHHGLVLLLHMQRHIITSEGIGLRHLCDWAVFSNSFPDEEWRRVFENQLKSVGLWRFAQIMSAVCCEYLNMPAKAWFSGIDKNTCEAMMEDILESGNFGRKDSARGSNSFFINKDSKKRSFISIIFSSFNRKICDLKPIFAKYKILLPIGYLWYIVRTSIIFLFHKNDLNIGSTFKSGHSRNKLYKELKFFEKQK